MGVTDEEDMKINNELYKINSKLKRSNDKQSELQQMSLDKQNMQRLEHLNIINSNRKIIEKENKQDLDKKIN